MQITLQLFGAFRPFGDTLALELPERGTVADLRPLLAAQLENSTTPLPKGLIKSSRFATETEILAESAPLAHGAVLAIIPPVSGG
ncbi:MAG: MoaD/ThiS family protein [Alphaproteobacteria bacterium]|nr:MoaD/ThiS family protein [Alphaproteobacteria bacterium]